MSRKILSLIVAVAFVLTSFSTAFAAAVPSDVVGTDYVKAVTKMQGLGIMVGDPDGKFRPADTIKRSEFAVIAVKAMGLNDAAVISKGSTKFSDVAADNWAAGYINVAVGANLISGYPDGTYKPDATINYSEAITILVRMLGYGPVLAGKEWPAAYVAKASEIGVTKDVVLAPTVGANRGDVSKLVNNSLTINPLIVSGYNDNNKPTYKVAADADKATIMEKNLKCTAITGSGAAPDYDLVVTNTPSVRSDLETAKANLDGVEKEFVSAINPDDYLGLTIKAWKNSDGKVVAVEVGTDSANIYDGIISRDDNGKIKLDGISKTYNTTSGAVTISLNNNISLTTLSAFTDTAVGLNSGTDKAFGRVVLDGVKVLSIYAWKQTGLSDPDINSNTFVLKEINKDGYFVGQKSINGTIFTDSKKVADYKTDATDKKIRVEVKKNGAVATIDDIKVGDVVTKIANGNHFTFIVTNNEVKGTIASVSGTDNKMKLSIGGKDYTLAVGASFTFNNDVYDKNFAVINEVVGKEVTAKLNSVGQIFGMTSAAGSKTYYYGIFKEGAGGSTAYSTIYKADGTKVSYAMEVTDQMNSTISGTNAGKLVQYRLTSDGKIADGSLVLSANQTADYTYAVGTATPSASSIAVGASTYAFDSTSVIFDVYDPTDVKVVSFDTIKDKTGGIYVTNLVRDGMKVKYAAVTFTLLASGNGLSSSNTGVVVGRGYDADGKIVKINEAGTVKTYKLSGTAANQTTTDIGFVSNAYVVFTVASSGKIAGVPTTTMSYVYDNTTAGQIFQVTSKGTDMLFLKPVAKDLAGVVTVGTEGFLNLDAPKVYDASNTDDSVTTILGGKAVADISVDDYVWVNQQDDDFGTANKVTVIVKVKKDNIKAQ